MDRHTEILIQLRRIIRSINLENKRVEKQYGLSSAQLLCMGFLMKQEDFKATQTEIKNYLKLNSSTVSVLITKLQKTGHVARLPKSGDKRTTLISLTSEGAKVIKEVPVVMHEKLSQNLNKLSEDELMEIKTALDTLIKVMGIEKIDASPLVIADLPPAKDED